MVHVSLPNQNTIFSLVNLKNKVARFQFYFPNDARNVGALRSSLNRTSWDINISSPLGRNVADMFHCSNEQV